MYRMYQIFFLKKKMSTLSISELANSKIEIEAEEQVLKEFTNINNNQAYD